MLIIDAVTTQLCSSPPRRNATMRRKAGKEHREWAYKVCLLPFLFITYYWCKLITQVPHKNEHRHLFSWVVVTAVTTTILLPSKISVCTLVFEGGGCLLPPQTRWEGGNPLSPCLLHIQTRQEGVYPFSVVLHSTQTWREGGNPFPLCFLSHRCNRKGFPLCLSCPNTIFDVTRMVPTLPAMLHPLGKY